MVEEVQEYRIKLEVITEGIDVRDVRKKLFTAIFSVLGDNTIVEHIKVLPMREEE